MAALDVSHYVFGAAYLAVMGATWESHVDSQSTNPSMWNPRLVNLLEHCLRTATSVALQSTTTTECALLLISLP